MIQPHQTCYQRDIPILHNLGKLIDLYKTTPLLRKNAMHHDSNVMEIHVKLMILIQI